MLERNAASLLLPVNSPVSILLFLAKDLGQLYSWFQTHFPNGFMGDNVNRNFNPFISERVIKHNYLQSNREKKRTSTKLLQIVLLGTQAWVDMQVEAFYSHKLVLYFNAKMLATGWPILTIWVTARTGDSPLCNPKCSTSRVESSRVGLLHNRLQHKFIPRLQHPTPNFKTLHYLD